MTLLAAIYSGAEWLVACDRRLSNNGILVDERSNKATVLNTPKSRLICVYTGLARMGSWSTQQFLEQRIQALAGLDKSTIVQAAQALRDDLAWGYSNHPDIQKADNDFLDVEVLLFGFQSDESPEAENRPVLAKISGMPDLHRFGTLFTVDMEAPVAASSLYVAGASSWLLPDARERLLRLTTDEPAGTLRTLLVEELRRAAIAAEAAAPAGNLGPIGRDFSTIVLRPSGVVEATSYAIGRAEVFAPTAVSEELTVSDFRYRPYADPKVGTPEWTRRIQEEMKKRNELGAFIDGIGPKPK